MSSTKWEFRLAVESPVRPIFTSQWIPHATSPFSPKEYIYRACELGWDLIFRFFPLILSIFFANL